MTKLNKDKITEDDLEINTEQVVSRQTYIFNRKYQQNYDSLAVCCVDYNIYEKKIVVDLCNHIDCKCFIGFINGSVGDHEIYCDSNLCYVLNRKDGYKMGDYLTTSNISGYMTFSDKNNVNIRCCWTFTVDELIELKVFKGFDRAGIIFDTMNIDGDVMSERFPKAIYIDNTGKEHVEGNYMKEQAKLKVSKIDIKKVNTQKKLDEDSIVRLSRGTQNTSRYTLTRNNSNVSIQSLKRTPLKKIDEKIDTKIEQTIFKAYLIPIM